MHAYPSQLADFVLGHWPPGAPLNIERRQLMEVLSHSFQASLSQEEGRPVRVRLVCAEAEALAPGATPNQFLALQLHERIAVSPDSLRRLSPATPFNSSLIGAAPTNRGWSIWGVVHTGAEWLAPTWGGRDRHLSLSLPEIHVLGPGRLSVYGGGELVATLERGVIEGTTTDVFTSEWLSMLFRRSRRRFIDRDDDPLWQADQTLSQADDMLVKVVSQRMVRRAIFLIRQAGHGGMILFADPELIDACTTSMTGVLRLKYAFRNGEASERYRRLLASLIQGLGEREGAGTIDVERFLNTETPEVSKIEQSIFEVSRLVAGLSAVDGAVVLNKRFDLIGFGAEVSGELPYPDTVWQALDVEAERRSPEPANSVGTRHRAAYRFVTAHSEGLAIVISHDGIVRFVANLGGNVVFWDQFLNW
jgi:hypothetical protein